MFIANAYTTVGHIMAKETFTGSLVCDRKADRVWRRVVMLFVCVICSASWNQWRTIHSSAVGSYMKMKKQSASILKNLSLFWFV